MKEKLYYQLFFVFRNALTDFTNYLLADRQQRGLTMNPCKTSHNDRNNKMLYKMFSNLTPSLLTAALWTSSQSLKLNFQLTCSQLRIILRWMKVREKRQATELSYIFQPTSFYTSEVECSKFKMQQWEDVNFILYQRVRDQSPRFMNDLSASFEPQWALMNAGMKISFLNFLKMYILSLNVIWKYPN